MDTPGVLLESGMNESEYASSAIVETKSVGYTVSAPKKFKSGIVAPMYCDIRKLYGFPVERQGIVSLLAHRVLQLPREPDVIAATATAGIGWGALVAHELQKPFVYVRGEAKGHGTGQKIEGHMDKGQHAVVIEDTISTAGSSIETVAALREESEATVATILSIYTYDMRQAFENALSAGVQLDSLTNVSAVVSMSKKKGLLTGEDAAVVDRFVEDLAAGRL